MKRIDIFLGKECNNNCIFCCSKDEHGRIEDLSTAKAKKMIREGFIDGAREIHFSGSEPTIRKDIISLVGFSKEIGYVRIKMTSNGRMFSYPDFSRKIIDAGLNDIIISIHGQNKEIHDDLTRVDGSFVQLMEGLKNLKNNKIKLESNTTIVKQNYKHLESISIFLVSLDLDSSELIFVHPKGLAGKNYDEIVPKLKDVEPYLKKALEIGLKNKKRIFSRYIPFCFLGDYQYLASELYEPLEIEQRGNDFVDKDAINTRRTSVMKKSDICKICKYDNICMGIHKEHIDDEKDFNPIIGNKIKNKEELIG